MQKKKVIIGFLGTKLDGGFTDKRWERWRPSVALFAHEDFPIHRMEMLLMGEGHESLADRVSQDMLALQPASRVAVNMLDIKDPWNFQEVYGALHDFAKRYDFRDDCDYYVHLTTGTHVAQICLFLLVESRYFPAKIVETNYRHKPEEATEAADLYRGNLEVIDLNLSTYDQLVTRFNKEIVESQDLLKGGISTRNAAFNQLIGRVERVALKSTAPILLTGPTGAGKSQLAARIFDLRQRRHLVDGKFVEINCATLRGDNAMSTLFGHKKGAYTGAISDRAGVLKEAEGGLLFLDEIGELGLDEQAMLLRALEDKRFMPMGSDKEVSSNFQLLAGTNRDLTKEVAQGRFRADLLARINIWQFDLPGLRDRIEDIEPNLDFEIDRIGRELSMHYTMTHEARTEFLSFALQAPWPGNFRDLSACVTRMATLCEAGRIGLEDVRYECDTLRRRWGMEKIESMAGAGNLAGAAQGIETQEATEPEKVSCTKLSSQRSSVQRFMATMGDDIDEFDRVQIEVVLNAIATTHSMAEAGRQLFAATRTKKVSNNDSDRVKKFLARWDLEYRSVKAKLR